MAHATLSPTSIQECSDERVQAKPIPGGGGVQVDISCRDYERPSCGHDEQNENNMQEESKWLKERNSHLSNQPRMLNGQIENRLTKQ
jgi:hypothetical protein